MAINFTQLVYGPCYDTFARPVVFDPRVSQPSGAQFTGRGIYNTEPMDVAGEDETIISESRVVLDVRDVEFTVPLLQGDRLTIPADNDLPALGTFEIIDTDINGGGETTLTLRKIVETKPA